MLKMANSNKKTLSKNLAQMKFMKRRSHDPTDRLLVDSNAGTLIEKWIAADIPPIVGLEQAARHEYVDSFVECEGLNQLGRFSFNKFNKDIERLALHYANGGEPSSNDDLDDEDGTIPAHEMARRYEEITSKKLLGKHKRSGHLEGETMASTHQDEAADAKPPEKRRHKELQKRLDKMDRRGFLKPS